jgi:N-acyl-D-amino-acid deacylase
MFADLVLFDPATVSDRATPREPHLTSVGISRVWVNGQEVYADGKTTGARPGQIIKRSAP